MKPLLILLTVALSCASYGYAQDPSVPVPAPPRSPAPRPPKYISPETTSEGLTTFRIYAPAAREVLVTSGSFPALALTRGGDGIWSGAVQLKPEIYEYAFSVDGLSVADKTNPEMKSAGTSLLIVPANPAAAYEVQSIPHGTVHRLQYHSKSLDAVRRLHVYTPPGYELNGQKNYPVLYLLHGTGDDDTSWGSVGRANWILDSLLAEGKIRPMIVVMPDGRVPGIYEYSDAPLIRYARFEKELIEEVMPVAEKSYRIRADQMHRAIAGNSLGGAEALVIGLNHLDLFSNVLPFSTGLTLKDNLEQWLPLAAHDGKAVNEKLAVFVLTCGTRDNLFAANNALDQWLTEHGVRHEFRTSDNKHEWVKWRRDLTELAPLLFPQG
jgi:enterochelin esterase family protein